MLKTAIGPLKASDIVLVSILEGNGNTIDDGNSAKVAQRYKRLVHALTQTKGIT